MTKLLDPFAKGCRTVSAEGAQPLDAHVPVIRLGHKHQQKALLAGVQLLVIDECVVHDGIASVSGNLEFDDGHVLVLLMYVVEKKQHDISSCCLMERLGSAQGVKLAELQ